MTEKDFRVQQGLIVADGNLQVLNPSGSSPTDAVVYAKEFNTHGSSTLTSSGLDIRANTIAATADGGTADLNINITPKGTGSVVISKVDINAGTVDDISSLTASGDLDIGNHGFRASTLTADSQTSGHVAIYSTDGLLSESSDLTFSGGILNATKIGAFIASGAIDFNSQVMTNVDINSGTIDGASINNTPIGASTANTGSFTTLAASGTTDLNGLLDLDGSFTADGETISLDATGSLNIDNSGGAVEIGTSTSGGAVNIGHATTSTVTIGQELVVGSDIRINGNDIKSSTGATAITLSGTNATVAGDLTVTGNDIKASDGTTAITLSSDGTGSVTIAGDLNITGDVNSVSVTDLDIVDKTITLASGASLGSQADGAGIVIGPAIASIKYIDSGTKFQVSSGTNFEIQSALVMGTASINSTDLEKLDDITNGVATANKALVVDGSKDIGTLGTVTAATFTANTSLTTPQINVDSVAYIDTSSATGQSITTSGRVIATFPYGTYRTVKFAGHVVDDDTDGDTDAFEVLVTYKGDSAPSAIGDTAMTTYAYLHTGTSPMGTLSVALSGGTNIDLVYTADSNFTGSYAVTATQLIKT